MVLCSNGLLEVSDHIELLEMLDLTGLLEMSDHIGL